MRVVLAILIVIMFGVAPLASASLFLVTPRLLQGVMEEISRHRKEEGYRLDISRPFLWLLATWPRRALFSLLTLAISGWSLWTSWPS